MGPVKKVGWGEVKESAKQLPGLKQGPRLEERTQAGAR